MKEKQIFQAYEEDSVTLHATVNRVNAPVKWQRGRDPVRGDRFHTTSDGNTHYLTINPLKRSDTDEYMCHVDLTRCISVFMLKVRPGNGLCNSSDCL